MSQTETEAPAVTEIAVSWIPNDVGRYDEVVDLDFYRASQEPTSELVRKVATQIAYGTHGPMVKVIADAGRDKFVPLAQVYLYTR